MVDLIVSLIEGLIHSVPSKRNRTINKKFKLLRQEKWFKELLTKYGPFLQLNDSVRTLIGQKEIEVIVKDIEKTNKFRAELLTVLMKEKL